METELERQQTATMLEAAQQIRRIIRNELDDAERAAKAGDGAKAASEADDAARKLKRIATMLGG